MDARVKPAHDESKIGAAGITRGARRCYSCACPALFGSARGIRRLWRIVYFHPVQLCADRYKHSASSPIQVGFVAAE
jgi:hypothetical protein